ncbi:MAG: sigma 54-interacting transcriptional regulator [Proteobacteria bacterium]|nr:sigma 54-interacting transcriptional regulator [Pseudomonadota bacterium]MBU1388069.1 sigma 54-interacting transcriptional regulator [Pseudomonadota bacterium]MBU1542132.1 sigma 54-interacting transcriptional regulator [Pseudomonadota bacterium]MBU2431226.1 sigma 54-interacting transcriptional regulator [Pseudomonadota bacterium]MBU2482396.1 sigma 54-interacting transcriptional regulator [Pseudomonadota bacterium]
MITIKKDVLNQMANPALLIDGKGHILMMNPPAESMLESAGFPSPATISGIDPLFGKELASGQTIGLRNIQIGKASHRITIFPVKIDGDKPGCLYLFDIADILKQMDFDTFLDHVDVAIGIMNQDGILEHLNDTMSRYIGVNAKEWIGSDLHALVEDRAITDSASLKALEMKKSTSTNVTYGSGVTLQYQSIPFFDKHGKIKKVISTGRDISRIIQLENDLSCSQTLKEQYYQKLNSLEVLLGRDKIVYSSEQMKRVAQVAVKAGRFDSPVLLWGESGVGKEMIARMIHQSGSRSQGPFVGVNCSAVPSELLESEFFGYEEGAFTGAKKGGQNGLFDEAKKGTLFLDEISELPLGMQSKLLRVIQEQEFMRVGASRTIPTDVRLIASSNLSREQLADETRFRRDLFYRLSVVPIYIPPLRERRDDILPLIRFFLKELNFKYASNVRINNSLIPRLYHYDWPGNVRELKNVIERLIVVADSDEVGDPEYDLANQLEMKPSPGQEKDISISRMMPLKEAIEKVEKILFKRAYQESGSIEKTAELLGINPSTIYRKIHKGQIRFK